MAALFAKSIILTLSPRVGEAGSVTVYAPEALLTKTTSPATAVYASAFIKNSSDENAASSACVAYILEALD